MYSTYNVHAAYSKQTTKHAAYSIQTTKHTTANRTKEVQRIRTPAIVKVPSRAHLILLFPLINALPLGREEAKWQQNGMMAELQIQ